MSHYRLYRLALNNIISQSQQQFLTLSTIQISFNQMICQNRQSIIKQNKFMQNTSNTYTPPLFRVLLGEQPKYDKQPKHSFKCACEMCQLYEHKALTKTLQVKQEIVKDKIRIRLKRNSDTTSANYYWILKRLLMPHNKIIDRSIQIMIPEIVFYKDGEAFQMFYNRDLQDSTVKKINKQKLSNTMLQKFITDKRRKYADLLKIKQGRKKVQAKKNMFGRKQIKKETKDAVVIRHTDGYEQLASENQFLNLLLKRKQDIIWKQISYIRNYVSVPPFQTDRVIMIKFSKSKIQFSDLFERAQNLIQVYGRKIIVGQQQYITDFQQRTFCQDLSKNSMKKFATYLVYKIVCYIENFYDEKIIKLAAGFSVTQLNHYFLTNVFKLQTEEGVKFDWTEETINNMVREQQQKIFFSKQISVNPEMESNSKIIEGGMRENYEKMKQTCGLTAVEEDNYQEIENNKFFRKLHPDFNQQITEILKNPRLTVTDFRKNYLGQIPNKKPIIKDFTSPMIKTIHYMTPRLSRADPHDYISPPKKNSLEKKWKINQRLFATIEKEYNIPSINSLNRTLPVK